jgi:hypothetical protein
VISAVSVAVGLLVAVALGWFLLWHRDRALSLSAVLVAVLALAGLWAWASHFGKYPQTLGAFSVSALAVRALWSWNGHRRRLRSGE